MTRTQNLIATLVSFGAVTVIATGCSTSTMITSSKNGTVYARASNPGEAARLQRCGRIDENTSTSFRFENNGSDKWVVVIADDGTYAAERGSIASVSFDDNWWREPFEHMDEITAGRVVVGMTMDEVRFSWGLPEYQSSHSGAENNYEQWSYQSYGGGDTDRWGLITRTLGFRNGVLQNIDTYGP